MHIQIVILLMIGAGILGGTVNYFLPANEKDGIKIRKLLTCILLGIGATMLVPLFLEIAKSSILDNLKFKSIPVPTAEAAYPPSEVLKNYLIYFAYCVVAAAAGFRFIDSVIRSVVKEQENTQLKEENTKKTEKIEKLVAQNQINQIDEEKHLKEKIIESIQLESKALHANENASTSILKTISLLPPITNPDDPQKGRFGGRPEVNGRKLSAEVKASVFPKFYNVKLIVESTDLTNNPLNSDVIFYIHDSFNPSIFTYTKDEFSADGKAVEDDILSYGAFTVGAITDNGKTLLELDLGKDNSFPEDFRDR
jgi:hypothetical protein